MESNLERMDRDLAGDEQLYPQEQAPFVKKTNHTLIDFYKKKKKVITNAIEII